MTVHEMHNTFRVLGQQMGLQLIRGILPESIDIFINDAINGLARTVIQAGVRTVIQEKAETQAQTMSPVNMFRTLYRSARFSIFNDPNTGTNDDNDNKKIVEYNSENGFHIIKIPTIGSMDVVLTGNEFYINPMMFLGFSVEYDETLRGNAIACRMIGADALETTLRDFCNSASKLNPIVCLSSYAEYDDYKKESMSGRSSELLELYTNTKDCKASYLNVKYIKTPNKVKYNVNADECIPCDLPDYTHFTIVEYAVQKFQQAIGGMAGGGGQPGNQRDRNYDNEQ